MDTPNVDRSKLEKEVVDDIKSFIEFLCSSCELFRDGLENEDEQKIARVLEMESEGDIFRREIASKIYEGAFLPYLRPNIYKLIELIDEVLDTLEDAGVNYVKIGIRDNIKDDILEISNLNLKTCRVFLKAFNSLFKGEEDLREATLAIRIYEKKVDEIKYGLMDKLLKEEMNFWEGKILSDFISNLVTITDLIEDAGDLIQMINVSIR